jgi:hypothetical protein
MCGARAVSRNAPRTSGVFGLACPCSCSGRVFLVGLDNLARQLDGGSDDVWRVSQFVDAVVEAAAPRTRGRRELYWCLAPVGDDGPASARANFSPELDRVLCDMPPDGELIRWVTEGDLRTFDLSVE